MTNETQADFAAASSQWWSVAARWLGWRASDFWQATPAELRGALRDPEAAAAGRGPSMETIAEMMERESNG